MVESKVKSVRREVFIGAGGPVIHKKVRKEMYVGSFILYDTCSKTSNEKSKLLY